MYYTRKLQILNLLLFRYCWSLFVVLCASLSIYLATDTWTKWKDTPIAVTSATTPSPVIDIPFPSVTVCSGYYVNTSNIKILQNIHTIVQGYKVMQSQMVGNTSEEE